jgi:hypothetical protein
MDANTNPDLPHSSLEEDEQPGMQEEAKQEEVKQPALQEEAKQQASELQNPIRRRLYYGRGVSYGRGARRSHDWKYRRCNGSLFMKWGYWADYTSPDSSDQD